MWIFRRPAFLPGCPAGCPGAATAVVEAEAALEVAVPDPPDQVPASAPERAPSPVGAPSASLLSDAGSATGTTRSRASTREGEKPSAPQNGESSDTPPTVDSDSAATTAEPTLKRNGRSFPELPQIDTEHPISPHGGAANGRGQNVASLELPIERRDGPPPEYVRERTSSEVELNAHTAAYDLAVHAGDFDGALQHFGWVILETALSPSSFRSRPIPPSSGRQKAADHFWAKKNSKNVAPSPKRPADLVLALSAASAPERTVSGLDIYATGGSFTAPVFVPVPPVAADLPVVRRALDAGTAERHLLSERLFKSIGDRGLHADMHRRLAMKCDWTREMLGYWSRREAGKQSVLRDGCYLVLQQDTVLETPAVNLTAMLNELDVAPSWAPLLTDVMTLHDFTGTADGGLFQKVMQFIVKLPWPFKGEKDAHFFAFASVALEEHGVLIGGTSCVDREWFGVSFPEPSNKGVKAVTFMLKPLPPSKSGKPRTNFTFMVKVRINAAEGSWLDWAIGMAARRIGTLLQSKIEGIVKNWANTEYAKRMKDNPKFYGYVDEVIQDYLNRHANEPARFTSGTFAEVPTNDGSFEFPMPDLEGIRSTVQRNGKL